MLLRRHNKNRYMNFSEMDWYFLMVTYVQLIKYQFSRTYSRQNSVKINKLLILQTWRISDPKALSPEIVGETVMDLFTFMQQNLTRPIDIFQTMQRTTIEVFGKLAFGYHLGVSISNIITVLLLVNLTKKTFFLVFRIRRNSSYYKEGL